MSVLVEFLQSEFLGPEWFMAAATCFAERTDCSSERRLSVTNLIAEGSDRTLKISECLGELVHVLPDFRLCAGFSGTVRI